MNYTEICIKFNLENLVGAKLQESNLKGADLEGVNLRGANLRGVNLVGADLQGANLVGANLWKANLEGAYLEGANLWKAYLEGANLQEANLEGAYLWKADLEGANLEGANLEGANLGGADLSRVSLKGATLQGANLEVAKLEGADLSSVKGLLNPIDYVTKNFKQTDQGFIVYKKFYGIYKIPKYWIIKENSIIEEVVNHNRCNSCTYGINIGTFSWVTTNFKNNNIIWECLIKFEWLLGVVVPYNTDGKIRCSKLQLIKTI